MIHPIRSSISLLKYMLNLDLLKLFQSFICVKIRELIVQENFQMCLIDWITAKLSPSIIRFFMPKENVPLIPSLNPQTSTTRIEIEQSIVLIPHNKTFPSALRLTKSKETWPLRSLEPSKLTLPKLLVGGSQWPDPES